MGFWSGLVGCSGSGQQPDGVGRERSKVELVVSFGADAAEAEKELALLLGRTSAAVGATSKEAFFETEEGTLSRADGPVAVRRFPFGDFINQDKVSCNTWNNISRNNKNVTIFVNMGFKSEKESYVYVKGSGFRGYVNVLSVKSESSKMLSKNATVTDAESLFTSQETILTGRVCIRGLPGGDHPENPPLPFKFSPENAVKVKVFPNMERTVGDERYSYVRGSDLEGNCLFEGYTNKVGVELSDSEESTSSQDGSKVSTSGGSTSSSGVFSPPSRVSPQEGSAFSFSPKSRVSHIGKLRATAKAVAKITNLWQRQKEKQIKAMKERDKVILKLLGDIKSDDYSMKQVKGKSDEVSRQNKTSVINICGEDTSISTEELSFIIKKLPWVTKRISFGISGFFENIAKKNPQELAEEYVNKNVEGLESVLAALKAVTSKDTVDKTVTKFEELQNNLVCNEYFKLMVDKIKETVGTDLSDKFHDLCQNVSQEDIKELKEFIGVISTICKVSKLVLNVINRYEIGTHTQKFDDIKQRYTSMDEKELVICTDYMVQESIKSVISQEAHSFIKGVAALEDEISPVYLLSQLNLNEAIERQVIEACLKMLIEGREQFEGFADCLDKHIDSGAEVISISLKDIEPVPASTQSPC
jgi:hypothetical protein